MKKYIIGEKYVINPHQSDEKWNGREWVYYNGEMAEFVGYVTFQNTEMKDFPVFSFDFYTHEPKNCFMVLYNDKSFAFGRTIKEMMDDFHSKISYIGDGYDIIMVGNIALDVVEFKKQATEAEVPVHIIEKSVAQGHYCCVYHPVKGGEIKWCPKCEKIRQTSCSACGCGTCKVCGHKWTCISFIPFT